MRTMGSGPADPPAPAEDDPLWWQQQFPGGATLAALSGFAQAAIRAGADPGARVLGSLDGGRFVTALAVEVPDEGTTTDAAKVRLAEPGPRPGPLVDTVAGIPRIGPAPQMPRAMG